MVIVDLSEKLRGRAQRPLFQAGFSSSSGRNCPSSSHQQALAALLRTLLRHPRGAPPRSAPPPCCIAPPGWLSRPGQALSSRVDSGSKERRSGATLHASATCPRRRTCPGRDPARRLDCSRTTPAGPAPAPQKGSGSPPPLSARRGSISGGRGGGRQPAPRAEHPHRLRHLLGAAARLAVPAHSPKAKDPRPGVIPPLASQERRSGAAWGSRMGLRAAHHPELLMTCMPAH